MRGGGWSRISDDYTDLRLEPVEYIYIIGGDNTKVKSNWKVQTFQSYLESIQAKRIALLT